MTHEKFMQRALELAQLGRGNVSPNPMVGCVIVHDGKIIGEGYHEKYGGPHAEVNAVAAVDDKSLLQDATVYVSLEPCAHFGKTPPCADLLVSHQVKKVIICNDDPNPKVAGGGIKKLKEAGISVESGVLEAEGRKLNRRFFTTFEKQRPYVILKWAQTADGFVARENFDSKWISNAYSRQLVHKWRAEEDAILVGKNTAKYDNPSLTTRDWHDKNPIRIFIDRDLSLPDQMNLKDGSVETICFTVKKGTDRDHLKFIMLDTITPKLMLRELHMLGIQSLIVEGGSYVLNAFIEADLWDEARVFTSKATFGGGISAPVLSSKPNQVQDIQEDQLTTYWNK